MIAISFSFAVKVAPAMAPAMVIDTILFAVSFGFMVVGCFPSFESVAMPNITTAARRWSGRAYSTFGRSGQIRPDVSMPALAAPVICRNQAQREPSVGAVLSSKMRPTGCVPPS